MLTLPVTHRPSAIALASCVALPLFRGSALTLSSRTSSLLPPLPLRLHLRLPLLLDSVPRLHHATLEALDEAGVSPLQGLDVRHPSASPVDLRTVLVYIF
ncbi:hypothetical protein B0H13DRAFT_2342372 [Mycena leptocephala]|nr:hypothetical protein B0H13DRAFT_2342372 [Mycena leptocephala]